MSVPLKLGPAGSALVTCSKSIHTPRICILPYIVTAYPSQHTRGTIAIWCKVTLAVLILMYLFETGVEKHLHSEQGALHVISEVLQCSEQLFLLADIWSA
jgi:hypothetical protein